MQDEQDNNSADASANKIEYTDMADVENIFNPS